MLAFEYADLSLVIYYNFPDKRFLVSVP